MDKFTEFEFRHTTSEQRDTHETRVFARASLKSFCFIGIVNNIFVICAVCPFTDSGSQLNPGEKYVCD